MYLSKTLSDKFPSSRQAPPLVACRKYIVFPTRQGAGFDKAETLFDKLPTSEYIKSDLP